MGSRRIVGAVAIAVPLFIGAGAAMGCGALDSIDGRAIPTDSADSVEDEIVSQYAPLISAQLVYEGVIEGDQVRLSREEELIFDFLDAVDPAYILDIRTPEGDNITYVDVNRNGRLDQIIINDTTIQLEAGAVLGDRFGTSEADMLVRDHQNSYEHFMDKIRAQQLQPVP